MKKLNKEQEILKEKVETLEDFIVFSGKSYPFDATSRRFAIYSEYKTKVETESKYTLKEMVEEEHGCHRENGVELYLDHNLDPSLFDYSLNNFDGMENEFEEARIEAYINNMNISFKFNNFVHGEVDVLDMFKEIDEIIKTIKKIKGEPTKKTNIKRALSWLIRDFNSMKENINEEIEGFENIECLVMEDNITEVDYVAALNRFVFSIIDNLEDDLKDEFINKNIDEIYSVLHSFPEYDFNSMKAINNGIK